MMQDACQSGKQRTAARRQKSARKSVEQAHCPDKGVFNGEWHAFVYAAGIQLYRPIVQQIAVPVYPSDVSPYFRIRACRLVRWMPISSAARLTLPLAALQGLDEEPPLQLLDGRVADLLLEPLELLPGVREAG